PASDPMSPEDLARSPAVRLFVERVWDVRPDFRLTAKNGPAVTAICRRLDALPLALELAARWMKMLTAEDVLRRRDTDDPPAPRGKARVGGRWQGVGRDEERAFRGFGVLPGLFSIDAAAQVLAGRDGRADSTDDAVRVAAGLIDRSLLLRAETSVVATRPLYY